MRRLLIFSLLGPPLSVLFIALLSLVTTGHIITLTEGLLLLPYAYVLGLIPSLLAALGDWLLAKKVSLLPRLGGSACVGFLVIAAPFAFDGAFQMMVLGLGSAIASVVCSVLVLATAAKSNMLKPGQG